MVEVPHIWQFADTDKTFVFALNEEGINEFDFFVNSKSKKKALEVAALAKSAPALLEALEKTREDINWMLNSRQFLNADQFNYIDAAIAAAKGEV